MIGRYDSESEDEDNNAMLLEDTYMLVKSNPSETKQPMAKSRTIVIFTLEDNMGEEESEKNISDCWIWVVHEASSAKNW